MAFKMKGPMFFGSSLKKHGKKSEPMMKKDDGVKPDYPDIDGDGDTSESMKKAASDKEGSSMNYGKKMKPATKMKSPVKKNPGIFGKVTKADVEKMTGSERQAYGRKIFRGPGTTDEKYKKLRDLDIELKGHDDAY
jgi:hypothetical protein